MSISAQLRAKRAKSAAVNASAMLSQPQVEEENKLANLSRSDLSAVIIYNQQVANQIYGVSSRDLCEQVRKNLNVGLDQGRVHQFTESTIPDKNVGQHYYIAALPMNPNIAPSSRVFMQQSNYTPLDSYSFLQEKGLEFNSAVVSAMIDTYKGKVNNINIQEIFAEFKSREGWVLDETLPEVRHFLAEIAKVFNFFSTNESPIRSFVNINNNAQYLVVLFDMLNIEHFTLLYNWIVAQDVEAMNDLLRQANRLLESLHYDRQKPNYRQNYSEQDIRIHELYMKSILSLYERIRYFQKNNVLNSVFHPKNQDLIKGFLNKQSSY